ncbi:hypothetical protein CALCODRAFT_492878 [Calocera cornea HHB12733]|uniref:BRCT domain-containing protein n=1 Tax=Calocera cornea HHB12733 TaxID=1353952 RepID=A0A165I4A7_9BASI|nr:hypothetical protein CALCODRAFT_492878 [Calocera cornea HHB12733]
MANSGGAGLPLIFVNREGQPMRFFVDAGGDIDSNTRRTSLRKIQRRGGQIVFNPAEAQYIIVWDDTSDGQLLARNWSNEGKIVLTLEWINICVRENKFIGPLAGYGGCRVGVTDGAIQPLSREGVFDEEEESLPIPPRSSLPSVLQPASTALSAPLSQRHRTLTGVPVQVPSFTGTAATGPLPAYSETTRPTHTTYASNNVTSRSASPNLVNENTLPVSGPTQPSVSHSVQDFKTLINQLQPSTFAVPANALAVGSTDSSETTNMTPSQRPTSITANLLSAIPQQVLDMLTQTLHLPSSNHARASTLPAPVHHTTTSVAQELSPTEASFPVNFGIASGASISSPHPAALASPATASLVKVSSVLPHETMEPINQGTAANPMENEHTQDDNRIPAVGLAREYSPPPQHSSLLTTPDKSLKRKHLDDAQVIVTPSDPIKRSRLSSGSVDYHQLSPSVGYTTPQQPPRMPSSSQGSGSNKFFTLEENGRHVQASFWVQPEIKERTKLIRAINRHGGRIAHSMSDCHYVVVRSALSDTGKSGKNKNADLGWKYDRTVVKPSWIEACIAAQDLVDIDEYVMEPPVTPKRRGRPKKATPTPTKSRTEREDSTVTLADVPHTPNGGLGNNAGSSLPSQWKMGPVAPSDSDDEEAV